MRRRIGRAYKRIVRDLLFPVLTAGFFALAALAVVACERLVGVEPSRADTEGEAE